MEENAHALRPRITPKTQDQRQLMDEPSMPTAMMRQSAELSEDLTGILPSQGMLANPYVPFQREGSKRYEPDQGFIRGTLFPGLDLPFMGMVNTKEKDTPLAELQALSFAVTELGLYLDTHRKDKEALALFEKYTALYKEGVKTYEKRYGSLQLCNAGGKDAFNWTCDPWPWDYKQETEG